MARWSGERRSLSPLGDRSDQGWDTDLGRRSLWHSIRSSSPPSLLDLDLWESRSLFKTQKSSAWSCMGLSGSSHRSKISTSSLGSQCGQKHMDAFGVSRWPAASRLAPEGAPRSHLSTEELELRAALEESSIRRAELVQRLRKAKGHLDTQTDLLKTRETQLKQSQSISHFLELKHKQLSEAVSALEQDKEAAELSRFEESRRRGELQDKVLQLEMDILKMRSTLDRRTPPTSPNPKNPLNRTLPVTKDEILREGQKQAEKGIKELRAALRDAEDRADDLEAERDDALRQLKSCKEGHQEVLNQSDEIKQRLNSFMKAQAELEDQLKDAHGHLGQMELERDLLSTKTQRLEDSLDDVKAKLSAALLNKDRLVQEKAELYQRVQALELQLQREQRGKQGFTEQVCELHSELSQAKSQANRQKRDTILLKDELQSVNELNEKLSSDLANATERLHVTLSQLHELEAEKLIQANQIAALETERLKLIGEKEEVMQTSDDGVQDEITELREKCCHNRELQENLEQEKKNLQVKCQSLEKKVQIMEVECNHKEEELRNMRGGFEQEKEELRKVAGHWNERWLDVAMTLCSTQADLEEAKKQQQENEVMKDAAKLSELPENLQKELSKSQDENRSLHEEKANLQTELNKVKREIADLEVELDACKQQLDPTRKQSQSQRLMGNSVSIQVEDGELVQVKVELQRLWDMLKIRESELHEMHQELQSAHGKVSLTNGEVQRLEQLLTDRDQELREKEQDLKKAEKQRQTEKTEGQMKISALETELLGYKRLESGKEEVTNEDSPQGFESLKAPLEESKRRIEHLEERKPHDLGPSLQAKPENESPPENKKQKPAGSDVVDPNQQRRLVTEQLKSLFREREQRGERSPVFSRKPGLVENAVRNGKSIKEPQQGAANEPSSQISVAQGGSMSPERGEDLKQLSNLKETHSKTHQAPKVMSHHQIQTLRARAQPSGEITLTTSVPHLTNTMSEREQKRKSPLGCKDGTFHAKQVEVCESDVEDTEESTQELEGGQTDRKSL